MRLELQLGIVLLDSSGIDGAGELLPVHAGDNQYPSFKDLLDDIRTFVFWDELASGIGAYAKHLLEYKVAGSEFAWAYFPIEGSGHASLIALPMT